MTDESPLSGHDPELLIAEIAEDFLRRIEQGENPSVEEYIARYPALAETLRQVLPVLTMVGSSCDVWNQAHEIGNTGVLPERVLGDFKIVREVGRGGMGVVYEAQEISLGRRVALKVLPFAAVLDSQQLKRFKIEAQVAAQLHHTHIVPVYSVGHERGVHYYAMQYVEGHTLSAVIRELREFSGWSESPGMSLVDRLNSPTTFWSKSLLESGSTQTPEYVQSVARLGIQAAEALQHAHDLAIVHRDIKPSNLILDARGHLWITDFGLAQCRSNNAVTLTLPGDIMGTVCYMSPEQALGQHGRLDHRTDIYSLAMTLYEMLALKPAFTGRNRQQLLARIESEEPSRLSRLNPAVSSDLETVLYKAMAKEPCDRYDSARALAEDLDRFLEHRPIQATRPTLVERMSKWSRRHRMLLMGALLLLLLGLVGLSVSTLLIWQEKGRTDLALADVEAERARAQSNYERARDAVDEMTRVVEKQLAGPSAVASTRREVLFKAQAFYHDFLKSYENNRLVSIEAAMAYQRISAIYVHLGQYDQAQQSLSEAVKVLDHLTQTDSEQRVLLGDLYIDLGNTLYEQGQLPSSQSCYGNAIEICRDVLKQNPDDPQARLKLAEACMVFGRKLFHADQRQRGLDFYRQGTDLKRALAEENPDNLTYQTDLAMDLVEMGRVMWEINKRFEAESVMRQSIQRFELLERRFPDQVQAQWAQVRARMRWALALWQENRVTECNEQIVRAHAFQKRLLTRTSDDPMYNWSLASNQMAIMNLLRHMERLDEAVEVCYKAVALKEQIIAVFPHELDYQSNLATNYLGLGDMLRRLERWHDADKTYEKAITLGGRLADEFPRRLDFQISLVQACLGHARVLYELGRMPEAQDLFQHAKHCQATLLASEPKASNWSWRKTWGWSLHVVLQNTIRIAEIHADWAQPEQAAQTYIEMIDVNPDDAFCWYARAMGQWNAGDRRAYEHTCRLMLDRFRETSVCRDARLVAWTCTMTETVLDDGSGPLQLLNTVYQHDNSPNEKGQSLIVIGAVLYRAGRFEEAQRELTGLIRTWDEGLERPRSYSPAYASCFLAMTHARLGRHDKAAEQLAKAKDTAEQETRGFATWYKRTTQKHVIAEAESLIRDLAFSQ